MKKGMYVIAALLVVGIINGLSTLSAVAIESFGVGAVPANPRADNPRTKSIFVYEASPGKLFEDSVQVINNSKETRTIKVYPVDSERSSDGAFACAQAVDTKKDVGSWIQLSRSEVALEPNKSEKVPFQVRIPNAAEVGEHNGCIAIEEAKPGGVSGGSNNGIVLSFRSALRVAILVPGDINAKLQFNELKVEDNGAKIIVSPVVKNMGNVSVDADIHASLSNAFGQKVAEAGGQYAVLMKDESRFNFEMNAPFWGGWYQVQADASYKMLRLDAGQNTNSEQAAAPSRWLFVMPQPAAVMIYFATILLIVGSVIWLILTRRQKRLLHLHTTPHTVAAGENLQSLAEISGVSWQKLAKLNNLRPPYALAIGQRIRLPDTRRRVKSKKPPRKE